MIRECLVTRDYCVCSRGASFFLNTRFWFTVCSFSPKQSTALHKNTNKQEHINAEKIKICAHIFLEFKNLRLGLGEAGEGKGGLSFTRWHFWVWFRKDSTCFPEGILQYWPEARWWRCGGGCQSRLMLMVFLPQRLHRSWKNRSLGPAIQSLEAVGPKLETPGGGGGGRGLSWRPFREQHLVSSI